MVGKLQHQENSAPPRYAFNVHQDSAAFGVGIGTTLNVYELLKAVNQRAVAGMLYHGDVNLRDLAEDLFDRLNRAAD